MRKHFLILLLAAVFLALPPVFTTQGVLADGHNVTSPTSPHNDGFIYIPLISSISRTGQQLAINQSGSKTYKENAPFYIAHGWILESTNPRVGLFDFKLEVDGVYRDQDYIETHIDGSASPDSDLSKVYVFNFPNGMTGVHSFTGHWLAPCSAFYDNCVDPDQIMETRKTLVGVTFIP